MNKNQVRRVLLKDNSPPTNTYNYRKDIKKWESKHHTMYAFSKENRPSLPGWLI